MSPSAAPWCCPQPCAQLLHSSVVCCYLIKPFLLPHFDSVPCRVGPLIPGLLCFASQSSVPPHLSVMQAQGGDFTVMSNMMLWLPIFPYIVLFFSHLAKRYKTPLVSAGSCFALFLEITKNADTADSHPACKDGQCSQEY